jgi:heme/copper-type cytochrome/quinol oxidase subunit 4
MSAGDMRGSRGGALTNQAHLQRQAISGFCLVLAGILFLIAAAGEGGVTTSVVIASAMALVGTTLQFVAFRRLCCRLSS